jgi:hypothetical protein
MRETTNEQDYAVTEVASSKRAPYEAPEVIRSLPFENVVLADAFECGEGCTTDGTTGDPC